MATPHARGSTQKKRRLLGLDCGYPACAGIDPRVFCLFRTPFRLPRMRGDRPLLCKLFLLTLEATPHARGSTHVEHYYRQPGRGYPACAGIDP